VNGVALQVPPELIEAVAQRAAELVLAAQGASAAPASPWMTTAEAAEYLSWPRDRLDKLTSARAIPHRKHEGRVLFHRRELDEWLDGFREGMRNAKREADRLPLAEPC